MSVDVFLDSECIRSCLLTLLVAEKQLTELKGFDIVNLIILLVSKDKVVKGNILFIGTLFYDVVSICLS